MGSNAKLAFPEGFLWGSATSSYQVEGGNENNDWWAWEHIPGRIRDGSRCGPASDWWHRAETDLDTAAQLGQNTHRLSLEWSRIEPEEGAWDDAAIVRYRQILSAMRELDILPLVTLHHFTLPLWLYERGGWEYERAATHFARYVNRVVAALSDLCQIWCTINEPMVHLAYGYIYGLWPPGYGGWRGARRAFRHMAEAHAKAYEVIHHRQPNASVGYAKQIHLFDPAHPGRWRDRIVARAVDHLFNESALAAYADGTLLFPFGRERRDGGVVKWLPPGGSMAATSNGGSEPVEPSSCKTYSPAVPFMPETSTVYVPVAAAGCVNSALRPSAAPLSFPSIGIPDGSYSTTAGSSVLTNSFGPSAGVNVVIVSGSP